MPEFLPRLRPGVPVAKPDGTAAELFVLQWQTLVEILEGVPAIQEAADNAQAAADAANIAAANANSAAEAVTSESSLVNSFIPNDSFAAPLIEADSAGNVTIANHSRQYGDQALNPTQTVTGNTITTTAVAGETVRVYYNDAARVGGAVSYLYTIDPAYQPFQGGTAHVVGAVVIPVAGTQGGNYVRQPGFVEP